MKTKPIIFNQNLVLDRSADENIHVQSVKIMNETFWFMHFQWLLYIHKNPTWQMNEQHFESGNVHILDI